MAKLTKASKKRLLGIALAVTLLTGCKSAGYRDPISKFQSASSVIIASTRLYVTELNKVERDHYIAGKLNERVQIRLDELEEVQVFSQESLRARLETLDQMVSYGNLLLKLANSEPLERVRAEAQNLGEAIKKNSGMVSGLMRIEDAAFKAAVAPATTIIKEVLDLIAQQKIKHALDKAIKDGEASINKLLAVIGSDITIAYERKRNSLSDMRADLVDEYNNEMSKGPDADAERLRLYTERIRAHEDRWETFASANPGDGLDAMAKAHTALVSYAKSGHKAKDLESLVEAMEAFAVRAVNISQAVHALRGN
jgi:hypothetical protein